MNAMSDNGNTMRTAATDGPRSHRISASWTDRMGNRAAARPPTKTLHVNHA